MAECGVKLPKLPPGKYNPVHSIDQRPHLPHETLRSATHQQGSHPAGGRGAPRQYPRVFGSVVHGDDTEGSDLDILIDPTPETTLFDIGAIRHDLLQLLGMPVDVLTPKALPEKFRAAVLAEAEPV